MRFNPPPSWPPVPPGWTPGPNWQPDPSWGPAPAGWPFWVDDAVPPQYPSPYLPGYPAPYPAPQPDKTRRNAPLVLVAILALAVLVGGSIWYLDHGPGAGGSGKASKKHDITSLNKGLLLDRSQFSGFDGSEWISDLSTAGAFGGPPESGIQRTVTPAECSLQEQMSKLQTAGGQTATSTLAGSKPAGTQSTSVGLILPAPSVDMKGYVQRCPEFTSTSEIGGDTLTQKTTLQLLNVSSLPSWATAYSMKLESSTPIAYIPPLYGYTVMIMGSYRGVMLGATQFTMSRDAGSSDPGVADKLAQLFNAQVAKLEAAP